MIIEIIRGALIISIPIGFYFIMGMPGILLGMAISFLICSFHFFRTISFRGKILQNIKSNFTILLHNFGVDFSTRAPRFVDKLVVLPILGSTNLGIYQLNIQILFGLELLPIALHSFLLSEETSGKKHKKISYIVVLASIIIAIIAIFE